MCVWINVQKDLILKLKVLQKRKLLKQHGDKQVQGLVWHWNTKRSVGVCRSKGEAESSIYFNYSRSDQVSDVWSWFLWLGVSPRSQKGLSSGADFLLQSAQKTSGANEKYNDSGWIWFYLFVCVCVSLQKTKTNALELTVMNVYWRWLEHTEEYLTFSCLFLACVNK